MADFYCGWNELVYIGRGRRIVIDPELPLDVHHILGELGTLHPDAFALPDVSLFTERNCRVWERQCREILKLPLEGAYPQLVKELLATIADVQLHRERARVLTLPLMDEGTNEGEQRIQGLFA